MPHVVGVFEYIGGARRAVKYLEDIGINPGDISVIAFDPTADKAPHPDAKQGATAGAGAGAVLGSVSGALSGLGLVAIPGAGPLVASGWLVTAITGGAAGAAVAGAAGGALGFLMSTGFVDPEDIDRKLKHGSTIVRVTVPEMRFFEVKDAFQNFANAQ